MTPEHLKKLLAEGEGFTVEFKKCQNQLSEDTVFETVSSFSNRYGGWILIGVDDDGVIRGVNRNSVEQMKKNFANTLNNPERMSPTLFLSLEETEVNGKLVLSVYVPVSSQIQMFNSRIYDRNEDGDMDITKSTNLIAQMSIRKSNSFTERRVFPYARESDLLLDELMPGVRQLAVNRVAGHPWGKMNDREIMKSAGLYEEDIVTGNKGFNLAGILLFGRDEIIQQAAPGYVTDCLLRVENTDRYDDRDRVECNLIQAFDRCMDFIRKHTLDRFFLIDSLNVSVRDHIAKEVVSNVLCHREFSGTFPARIIVEKNLLISENWNRPQRPGRVDLTNYEPSPKNPILARFFTQIGFADTLGSGVRSLYKYTRIYSGGEPELIEGDIFRTIIPLSKIGRGASGGSDTLSDTGTIYETDGTTEKGVSGANVGNEGINVGNEGANVGNEGINVGNEGANVGNEGINVGNEGINVENEGINGEVNREALPASKRILEAIRSDMTISYEELAAKLSMGKSTVYRHISTLKDAGTIERIGSRKTGYWQVNETRINEAHSNRECFD